jgi:hypothetical protein
MLPLEEDCGLVYHPHFKIRKLPRPRSFKPSAAEIASPPCETVDILPLEVTNRI